MSRISASCIGLLTVGAALGPAPARAAQEGGAVTAFVDVTVIPMDSLRTMPKHTVLVRDHRVIALGPVGSVAVPADAKRVDGRGKYLIPALADMHVHSGFEGEEGFTFLANGIATVRDPGGGNLRAGPPKDTSFPRAYFAVTPTYSQSPSVAAQNVAAIAAAGFGAIKLPTASLETSTYEAILAAAREGGLDIVGHAPAGLSLERVLSDGWSSIEHLSGYFEYAIGLSGQWSMDGIWFGLDHRALIDTAAWMKPGFEAGARLRTIAGATARAGVWNCPTLVIFDGLLQAPDTGLFKTLLTPEIRQTSRRFQEIELAATKALQDAGAGLLLGTDQDAFSIHRELQLLVEAGLTPYQALVTGTRNPAVFLGTLDSTGTIAVGKRADLVLLAGNPLEDIRQTARPAGVMVGGRWYDRPAIDAELDRLAASHAWIAARLKALGMRP